MLHTTMRVYSATQFVILKFLLFYFSLFSFPFFYTSFSMSSINGTSNPFGADTTGAQAGLYKGIGVTLAVASGKFRFFVYFHINLIA